jgi:glycosyltransferase involved in cell wall biosynthesis
MDIGSLNAVYESKTDRPRILVLTTCYPSNPDDPSGIFVSKLLEAISRRGYSIKVIAPTDGTFSGRKQYYSTEMLRFSYFFPKSLQTLTRGGGGIPENMAGSGMARIQVLPMMAAFFYHALREASDCRIIYANWIGAGFIGALLASLTGKPLVVSFRGDDGYLARDRPLWRRVTKWVISQSSIIAPVSRELADILIKLGLPKEKCFLPKFGVDTEMFFPITEVRPNDSSEIILLFVGSLISRKGLHDLIDALADKSLSKIRLIVVGDGPDRQELEQRSIDRGINMRTEWKGLQSPREVARLMRSADIVCLPSYMEGRPNVVNEAMASGVPVVATRIGGIPDMVAEGETAYLFDPGDVKGLRECLLKLASDECLRSRMGKAGYDFVTRAGVSWDATAEDFDQIFQKVILTGHRA